MKANFNGSMLLTPHFSLSITISLNKIIVPLLLVKKILIGCIVFGLININLQFGVQKKKFLP